MLVKLEGYIILCPNVHMYVPILVDIYFRIFRISHQRKQIRVVGFILIMLKNKNAIFFRHTHTQSYTHRQTHTQTRCDTDKQSSTSSRDKILP